ncbi:hypothetical protein Tco_0435148 [Tanacetum coccineum]
MVGRSLNVDSDPFRPCEEDEDVLGLEVSYLSAIGALIYLTNCTTISWRSQKQTLVATSSNHAEVIALHEVIAETCVAQMKEGYINSDRMKHIPPRYFAYTQDLIKDNQIEMKYVQSSNNSADLFTKALPTSVFKKHVHAIGMRHVQRT